MNVYGQLVSAQVEILGSDPAASVAGRIYFNTATNRLMIDDGTIKRAVFRNDQNFTVGSNATASNNVRINRAAPTTLQLVAGNDTTAEGTLSTALAQFSARLESYTLAALPTFGNIGRTAYVTDKATLYVDTGSAWVPVTTSPLTTKGDLSVFTTIPDRLPGPTASAQVLTADLTQPGNMKWALPGGGSAVLQNSIINGAFDIWQRGPSFVQANGITQYTADQWYVKNSLGTSGVISTTQIAGTQPGSISACSVKITTAPTASPTNGMEIYQVLDNQSTYSRFYNQSASFGVQVKALGNVTQVGLQFFYATTEIKPTTAIGTEILTTVNTSTFNLASMANQALGTAMTANGVIGVRIRATAVSTGNIYDINNGFILEQAMLAPQSTVPPFVRSGGDFGGEIRNSQRFYEKTYRLAVTPGANDSLGMFILTGTMSVQNYAYSYKMSQAKRTAGYSVTIYDASGNVNKVSVVNGSGVFTNNVTNSPAGGAGASETMYSGVVAPQTTPNGSTAIHIVIDNSI